FSIATPRTPSPSIADDHVIETGLPALMAGHRRDPRPHPKCLERLLQPKPLTPSCDHRRGTSNGEVTYAYAQVCCRWPPAVLAQQQGHVPRALLPPLVRVKNYLRRAEPLLWPHDSIKRLPR